MRYKYPDAITKNWVRPCFQLCMSIKNTIQKNISQQNQATSLKTSFAQKIWSICGAGMFLDVWQKLAQFSRTGYPWYQGYFSRACRYVSGQKEKLACVERGRGLGGRGKGRGIGERTLSRFSISPPLLPFLRPPWRLGKIAGQTNSLKWFAS